MPPRQPDVTPMLLRTVPAREGLLWIRLGFTWLARQPGGVLLTLGSYLLGVGLLSMVPGIGGLIPLAAIQVATVGFMLAGRHAAFGLPVRPPLLLVGLRGTPSRVRDLLLLALIYMGVVVGVLLLASLVDGGALLRLLLFGAMPDKGALPAGLASAAVVSTALYVPVSMAFWFAPVLVSWRGMGVAQALFTSVVIVWRNLGAFTLYATQWMVLFAVAPTLLATLGTLLGLDAAAATLLALPVGLALFLAFVMSFYATAASLLPMAAGDAI